MRIEGRREAGAVHAQHQLTYPGISVVLVVFVLFINNDKLFSVRAGTRWIRKVMFCFREVLLTKVWTAVMDPIDPQKSNY